MILCGPAVVLGMHVRTSRTQIARSPDGATLSEIREDGPEGGGALTYRVQGKTPGDTVDFVVSSNFSPGNGSRPQTVSPEMCRQRLDALVAELVRRKIPGVRVHQGACWAPDRAGLVRNEVDESSLGPKWRDGLPANVIDYVERRGGCNHWGGEEPYSKERRKEIDEGARRLRCDRIDADERKLRRKYADRPDVLRVIDAADYSD